MIIQKFNNDLIMKLYVIVLAISQLYLLLILILNNNKVILY